MPLRGLTAAAETAAFSREVHLFHLVEIHYATGTQYLTDAHKDITWNANTYASDGNLLGVDDIEEALELVVDSISITLSAVNQANISLALAGNYVNRLVVVWRGFFDTNEQVIVDPFGVFRGTLDGYTIKEGGDSSEIVWAVTSELADFERIGGRRTNNAEQQVHFPGDIGFEFAAQMVKDIAWGRS